MVTATALKLTVTTGQFRPKYHGHFPPEQVVTLFRNQVVNISETSTLLLNLVFVIVKPASIIAIIGLSIEVFKYLFLSAKSKKSKFLHKVNEALDKKHQENNHLLIDNFNNVAKETEEILIVKNVQLIEEIFDLYQVRSNQLINVINELKAIQVNL